jgi:hypothetical protein
MTLMMSYEVARLINEDRLAKAGRLLPSGEERADTPASHVEREADVIEVMFGARCEIEDAIA